MPISSDRIKQLETFAKNCGLNFKDYELLNRAFTHTSYAHDNNLNRSDSYERLEFLGDAVLKLAVSDILFKKFKEQNEGQLSEKRSVIVSDRIIAEFAQELQIEKLILTGKCEGSKGKEKESILACAFEAFLGAIYIEYKEEGYSVAKKFLIEKFENQFLNTNPSNPKAELQEYTQKIHHELPKYTLLSESGPAHNKVFTVGVYYRGDFIEKGEAKSKKEAEALAAQKALTKIKEMYKEETNA